MCSESSTTTPAMVGTLPVCRGADEAPSTRPEALASLPVAASGTVLESFNGGPLAAAAAALLRCDADADAASCNVSSKRWWQNVVRGREGARAAATAEDDGATGKRRE
jgi:hypothetical protein